jgi:glutathione S-transferase
MPHAHYHAFTFTMTITGIPTIVDHDNNDFVIWESNSVIKYLVDRYDKDYTIHFAPGTNESYLIDQWMTFQASGQVGILLHKTYKTFECNRLN